MNPTLPPPRRKSAFDEEFAVMQSIQEDRMSFRASMACHQRCVQHYSTNKFYLGENTCMRNCLEKINQVTVITNMCYGKHAEAESLKKKKK